tara:strand:+ start:233 stop:982 length:750 start_codon:yes stop_codon:yes gene_type:complete
MEQTKPTFPTEEVTLPSKGLLYPKTSPLSKGTVEMKYMTAKEEDILTNQNYIKNGTVIDKLLQSLVVTDIDFNELLVGDKNAILIAARILGYGSDYSFKYKEEEINIDLTNIEDKSLDDSLVTEGKNEFYYTLPKSKTEVTFKVLTHGDEKAINNEIKGLKKINKNNSSDTTTRMKYVITSINGDREKKTIREYVDNQLLAMDSRALRNYISDFQPNVDLQFDYEDNNGDFTRVDIPIGLNFFWPDAAI